MSTEKKILDFDKEEPFVSSRICEFILDNALKTNLSEDMVSVSDTFIVKHGLYSRVSSRYPFGVFVELINICRKANVSMEQFYTIGNKNHELHSLVTSFNSINLIEWKKELNFLRISLELVEFNLVTNVVLGKIIYIENKKTVEPLLHIIKGFFDRIYINCFKTKPITKENKNELSFTYKSAEVTNFDFIKFISDEQFFYSRIKDFIFEKNEEEIEEQISFFLFKDIGFSIAEIAVKLNLSVRSLQRKLKEENLSFRHIKEKVRKELSVRYLKDPSLSIHDVCMLLAYSERGAFEKAFKKWYGKNPVEYKKKLH